MNSTACELIHETCEGGDDQAFKMASKLVSELEELGATVTGYVSSQKESSGLTEEYESDGVHSRCYLVRLWIGEGDLVGEWMAG
jgi:hypothetical protein